ncbi:DUF1120 domain-containing protein [Herbaspirillum sp. LeCh32-8]|uniref:DUF1120 domain-containing protein n=1 Tax=Herbaspirillum sp. LeCh32-8 TaxID=2821356 RepID=UPI001AE6A037|nr:DUF1120 domain-containing protein [Herbaspirillum sp. LeCh32-8]
MKQVITLGTLATALVTGTSFAAATTELKVSGVIKPAACAPTIAGGGTLDYGNIPTALLKKKEPTQLAPKEVPFSFSCEAAVKVALRFTDNRAATKVSGLASVLDANTSESTMMGSGNVDGKNIGAYAVALKQGSFTADGVAVDTLNSPDQGKTWKKGVKGHFHTDAWLTWGATGTKIPVAVKTVSGVLSLTPVIDKSDNLPLSSDVKIDGSGTIEVMYL